MNKYIVFIISLLAFLGCNSREKNTQNILIEQSLKSSETTVKEHSESVPILPQISLEYYESRGLRNIFIETRNTYILMNPYIEELLSFQNLDTLRIGGDYMSGVNPAWSGLDLYLDFLFFKNLPQLKTLVLDPVGRRLFIENMEGLHYLTNLNTLVIKNYTYNNGDERIDISPIANLRNLTHLELYERKFDNVEIAFELPNLIAFWLSSPENNIKFENLSLSTFENSILEYLTINLPQIDLVYIGKLKNLKRLTIISPNINNIYKLENTELEHLTLRNWHDADFIGELNFEELINLHNLKTLLIQSIDVNDVKPLLYLPNLESVRFLYSVVDIMPLAESETLKKIIMDNEYYHKIEKNIFDERGIEIVFDERW